MLLLEVKPAKRQKNLLIKERMLSFQEVPKFQRRRGNVVNTAFALGIAVSKEIKGGGGL